MGIDTGEPVMEIEEAFDISIPDDRASEMTTVGEVYQFILNTTVRPLPRFILLHRRWPCIERRTSWR